jgi:hypothetical protein
MHEMQAILQGLHGMICTVHDCIQSSSNDFKKLWEGAAHSALSCPVYSWPSFSMADVKCFWLRVPLLSAYIWKMQGMKTLPESSGFNRRSSMETLPLPFARRENLRGRESS